MITSSQQAVSTPPVITNSVSSQSQISSTPQNFSHDFTRVKNIAAQIQVMETLTSMTSQHDLAAAPTKYAAASMKEASGAKVMESYKKEAEPIRRTGVMALRSALVTVAIVGVAAKHGLAQLKQAGQQLNQMAVNAQAAQGNAPTNNQANLRSR